MLEFVGAFGDTPRVLEGSACGLRLRLLTADMKMASKHLNVLPLARATIGLS
jgi:hypothetical protein